MSEQRVVLINMPWASLYRPSIQMGTLQSVLRRAGIEAEARSFNLAFMDYLATGDGGQSFSVDDYLQVSEVFYSGGLGDWLFAVEPFRSPGGTDQEYFAYLSGTEGWEELAPKALRMRELVPAFLERCVEDVLAAAPGLVGFTTTFSQNVPSLILAQLLKSREPSLPIVFGGSNCDGAMGDALHRSFPWVDVVVRGEGERVLVEVVRDLFAGRDLRPQPGLCYREGARRVVIAQGGGAEVRMDDVPVPDYEEYFARLDESCVSEELLPDVGVPFESARGCWWGEKKHCTFCGLNGSTMTFRAKSPDRVVADLLTLARRHKCLDFNAVDNIIAMPYFRELLPRLRDAGHDFRIFYETKSNIRKEHLRAMREAGVTEIQPGIESLSTPVLRLMEKGVTALQNIRLLKWCEELGLAPAWNVLYGFPGEPPEEYDRIADLMKSITHLPPPRHLAALDLQRFSPYHQRPREYGVEITGPREFYRLIYPCDETALQDLAYTFDYTHDDGRQPQTYTEAVRASMAAWQAEYPKSTLSYRRGPGFLVINDRRPGLGGFDHTLGEVETKVYLGCDAGATPLALWQALLADGETDISLEDVEGFLEEMKESQLMYEENGLYLALAVAAHPRAQSYAVEAEEAVTAPAPVFFKLARQVVEASQDS